MLLPGGVWRRGERRRDFAFRPVTGEVELALAEGAAASSGPSAQVTAALAAALAQVGGEPASPEVVAGLTVADRQFLARQLAAWLGQDGVWFTAACRACGADFDFHVQQSALPVKEAGEGAPFATVDTSLGPCRLRLPTGADQEAIAHLEDEEEALRALVSRCLLALGDGAPPEDAALDLGDDDLARIEEALETAAPEVALRAQAECPECAAPNRIWLDPYLSLREHGGNLFQEIHVLASAYHWSEADILRLPRSRRQIYLRLVDRARGMVQ